MVWLHIAPSPSASSRIWKITRQKGFVFSRQNFEYPYPMLSWKMQFLPHISSPDSWIWKIPRQRGSFFQDKCFEYPNPYVILKNAVFAHISPLQVVWFEKLQDKSGLVFLRWMFWVPTALCYLQNALLPNISSPSSQIWKIPTRTALDSQMPPDPGSWIPRSWTLDPQTQTLDSPRPWTPWHRDPNLSNPGLPHPLTHPRPPQTDRQLKWVIGPLFWGASNLEKYFRVLLQHHALHWNWFHGVKFSSWWNLIKQ